MKRTLILLVAPVLIGTFATTVAQEPTMSYQGVLRDEAGGVVPDGDYDLAFSLYDVESGGAALWTEAQTLPVAGGIVNAVLGDSVAMDLPFDEQYWLGISVEGAPELQPRVRLTAAPYAFRAEAAEEVTDPVWVVSGSDVCRLAGNVGIGVSSPTAKLDVAGIARVTGFSMPTGAAVGSVLTSDAAGVGTWQPATGGIGGGGTADNFAVFTGPTSVGSSTMYERYGTVTIPDNGGKSGPLEGGEKRGGGSGRALPTRLGVYDQNGWTSYAAVYETDAASDGRSALYGYRDRTVRNDGTGYAEGQTNSAITGYNHWGDSYTFGVAGFSDNDFEPSGGVLGAKKDGSYWGALGYKDASGVAWGLYTPSNAYVGGTLSATASNADKLDSQDGSFYQNATNLNTGTVAEARLPQNAIDSSEIEDGSVTGSDILNGTIQGADVQDETISTADIINGTIASVDIQDGAVATADILDGTIVNADISASAAIVDTKISGTAWTHANDGYPPRADYAVGSEFRTSNTSYVTVASAQIVLLAAGYVYAEASAQAAYLGEACRGSIAIDFGGGVDIYTVRDFFINDAGGDWPISTSRVVSLAAGTYTVSFKAESAWDHCEIYFPYYTLSVMYINQLGKAPGEE